MYKFKNGFFILMLLLLASCVQDLKTNFESVKKGVLSKIASFSEEPIIESKLIIQKIKGTVLISEPQIEARPAKEGEILKPGMTIETQDQSSALLFFGEKNTCKVRLGSRSLINIDDLLKREIVPNTETKTEKSQLNLIKGAVSLVVTNTDPLAQVSVKTKNAMFVVRGTTFSVMVDENYSLLVVKEGKVEAENFITFKKKIIPAGVSYLNNKEGREKEITKAEFDQAYYRALKAMRDLHRE